MAEDGIKSIAETAPQAGQDASGLDMAQAQTADQDTAGKGQDQL